MQSDGSQSDNPTTHFVQSQSFSTSSDTRGKHRIHAELKRLEQETRKSWKSLRGWTKHLHRVKRCLAMSRKGLTHYFHFGPLNPIWDRWFEGPQDSKGCCRCWIL
ncbi:guanine nucleotide-binding protein subunit gamma 1 isoform X2 [Medicago truncatula]|uniref:guanine nucleotide-binding protein subunit gamma 1 isoform X2 n=1 Tax=Medicago truncatula TaxID=3880 RepID=UPI000D2F18C0|nr:guanine nucleotide-binding protein subunit gamma 1 isoform X2 [Medicago truncatula]